MTMLNSQKSKLFVKVKLLAHALDLYTSKEDLPKPSTPGSAAIDLRATEDVAIPVGATCKVPTGLCMQAMNENVCALILPRSGLGTKHNLVLANQVALIDNDYRGEWMCFMRNEGDKPYTIMRGERFAQAMFIPFLFPVLLSVSELDDSVRGEGGFGSTGTGVPQ